ncbi:MAG: 30S ribosomal protein S7 [Verrucomicrobia bacterium RIFCSPHIGHO2_12_FULL_41_10]|nr:MAG: 30S ribosomal protein S7 [Verrucomicrobia bacterium RIFCSPHIGHO2_12_FULL_41_10]HLB34768.1 30S ribosomal protein S7 [Chthoniobacterales bacterium]
MSRRKRVIHKEVKRDLRYASPLVARLITSVMRNGKRSIAEKIVYTAIDTTRSAVDVVDPLEVLQKAIENIRPRLEVKSRRVGGATYQVPMEVASDRSHALAMRWLVTFASKRKGIPMAKALANELKDASTGQGAAIKKRDDLHKMAQANRAFAHFRW